MTFNSVSSRQEDREGPREGIYIGETSRSLHERAVERMKDAEAYSSKSHIIKHWMLAHPENNTPPPMAFKITSMYRDCLSHQIGEALRVNYSNGQTQEKDSPKNDLGNLPVGGRECWRAG